MIETKTSKAEAKQQAEAVQAMAFVGEVDPASMVISPHSKPLLEPDTKKIGGPGDPRSPSLLGFDTPQYGTETPYRKTPPTNVGSAAEAAATTTPPTGGAITQAQADAEPSPANTVAPAVTGTTSSGSTLTCAPGTWVPAAGSYQYQWYHYPDTVIAGATANTRVLAAGDVGKQVLCRVTGVHATYGGSSPAFSNVVGPIT